MRRAAALLVLGVALPACGGEDLGRPAPPTASPPLEQVDYCRIADELEFLPILDFEPAETTTAVCDVSDPDDGSRNCNWYPGRDMNHECVDRPPSAIQPKDNMAFPGEAIPGGLCGNEGSALHVTATRVAACLGSDGKIGWGANFQVDNLPRRKDTSGDARCVPPGPGLDEPGALKFDASCWEGVSFWARKNGPHGGSSLTLTVADVWTSVIKQNPETNSPYCSNLEGTPQNPVADSAKCDAAGAAISLTEEWTLYTLSFGELKQKGYGVPSPIGRIDAGNLTALAIVIAPGDWDFWVDDLSFFRRRL